MHSQIQGRVPVPGQDHYTSMMDCFSKIIKNEGFVLSWPNTVTHCMTNMS